MKTPNTSAARILVVGDVMLDRFWFGEVSRISPEAPVPVVLVGAQEERPGGAANVARNCAALGARVQLLSVIGRDESGARLAQLVAKEGVRAKLHRDPSLQTTQKLRVIGRQQQLLRIDFETAPSREVLASKLADFEEALPECDLVILSDYGKGGLTHITRMIGLARAVRKPVLVDPKGDDYSRYKGATMVTPNRAELRQVIGAWKSEKDLERRVQGLRRALGLRALLLTRSEEGMSLFRAGRSLRVRAIEREVYDVSGAGDTVIATVGVMLACGMELEDAVRVANRAAGIVVSRFGTASLTYKTSLFQLPEQVSLQYAYDDTILGTDQFLQRHTVSLSDVVIENDHNFTQAFFRFQAKIFENIDRAVRVANDNRTGDNYMVGFLHFLRFAGDRHYIKAGYQLDWDDTGKTDGRNWTYFGHRVNLGAQYTLPWWAVRLKYDLDVHFRDYVYKNTILPSYAPGSKWRQDQEMTNILRVEVPLPASFTLAAEYQVIRDFSNIEVFSYIRNVASVSLIWSY